MFLYRLLLTLAAPAFAVWLAVPLLRRRAGISDLCDRLGLGEPGSASPGPVIWLHGASNGELTSARALIETLLQRDPSLRIVVTANTLTGRDLVRGWALPRLDARLTPLDYRACLGAFLARHRPAAFLLLEGDLWPNRIVATAQRGIPVAMVSARMSERSVRKWCRLPGLSATIMHRVAMLAPQDPASGDRFLALGLNPEALRPVVSLKATVEVAPADPASLEDLRGTFTRDTTVLAASTHPGEEDQVLSAFALAREARPDLRMILAPRHPRRGDEIASLLQRAGLRFRRRAIGEAPDPGTEVYLADTIGEMALWYELAGACFVGGSLVPKGGHTPYEPAQFGCAILHGQSLHNFAAQYQALDDSGGAILTPDAEALGAALAGLDPSRRTGMARIAASALGVGRESLEPLLRDLAEVTGLATLRGAQDS